MGRTLTGIALFSMIHLMVDEALMDRAFLESLTTAELIKLADRAGIDMPPDLERIVIIAALLETMDAVEEGAETKPSFAPEAKRLPASTAPLPRHYNITYVDVLVRDPLWAFAFWEINERDREIHERTGDFGGYCLRVEPDPKPVGARAGGDSAFTVQVGVGDSAWHLGFSSPRGTFRVELAAMRKEEPVILAVSKPFTLPNLHEPLGNRYSKASHNPLLRLSGIDEFEILRDTSRLSRLPKHSAESAGTGVDDGNADDRE
jgi:hypothetical protein